MVAYKFLAVFLFAVCTTVYAEETPKCNCGVFKSPTPDTTEDTPIASKAPNFDLECNEAGKENCLNMCKALAEASKEGGPKKICEIVGDTDSAFVPLVYYKACDDKSWTYTGLKPTLNICCKAKEVVAC